MYRSIISPIIANGDSEKMHSIARDMLHRAEMSPLTLKALEIFFVEGHQRFSDPRLSVNLAGINFDNPVMVGAGWTKSGEALLGLYTLGFSGVEIGTVTENPQPGNEKPRQYMIGPGVAINWLGFNSPGMAVVEERLDAYQKKGVKIPVGLSIGKNKETERTPADAHAVVAAELAPHPLVSYLAINVSSPNTPGLRMLQEKEQLLEIVQAVKEKSFNKPIFVKISPELTPGQVNDVLDIVDQTDSAGVIATNSTNNPNIKAFYGEQWNKELGGLSGNDRYYRNLSTQIIAHIYREIGNKKEIIGVGGVNSTMTALSKIKAGASLIQCVTAIREVGTTLPGKINRGLIHLMDIEGVKRLDQLRGIYAHRYPSEETFRIFT